MRSLTNFKVGGTIFVMGVGKMKIVFKLWYMVDFPSKVKAKVEISGTFSLHNLTDQS